MPFPEDINKRVVFISILENNKLHPQVRDFIMYEVPGIQNDIERTNRLDQENKW